MSQQIPPPMPLQYAIPPRGNPSVMAVGLAQRRLMWAILGAILLSMSIVMGSAIAANSPLGQNLTLGLFVVVRIGFVVFMMICIYQMAAALGAGQVTRILYVIGMLIPLINLIILIVVNQGATKMLKSHGIRVGFMGAKVADLQSAGG